MVGFLKHAKAYISKKSCVCVCDLQLNQTAVQNATNMTFFRKQRERIVNEQKPFPTKQK